jgi:hypothetical protein
MQMAASRNNVVRCDNRPLLGQIPLEGDEAKQNTKMMEEGATER